MNGVGIGQSSRRIPEDDAWRCQRRIWRWSLLCPAYPGVPRLPPTKGPLLTRCGPFGRVPHMARGSCGPLERV